MRKRPSYRPRQAASSNALTPSPPPASGMASLTGFSYWGGLSLGKEVVATNVLGPILKKRLPQQRPDPVSLCPTQLALSLVRCWLPLLVAPGRDQFPDFREGFRVS